MDRSKPSVHFVTLADQKYHLKKEEKKESKKFEEKSNVPKKIETMMEIDSANLSKGPKPQVVYYSCTHCTCKYTAKSSLYAHSRIHGTKRYRCLFPGCSGYQTYLSSSIYQHIQGVHFGVSYSKKKKHLRVPKVDLKDRVVKRWFEVVNIEKEDTLDSSSRKIRNSPTRKPSILAKRNHPTRGPSIRTPSKPQVTRNPQTNQYHCPTLGCDYTYKNRSSLYHHSETHLGLKRYRCRWPDCAYSSYHGSNVRTHIRAIHLKLSRTLKKQRESAGLERLMVEEGKELANRYMEVMERHN